MKKINTLLFCICVAGILQAQTATAPSNYPGHGTSSSDPYLIANLNNLYWLATQVNAGTTFQDVFFKQTANIDASSTSTWFSGAGWTPISGTTTDFFGSYDGQGYIISGLYINRISDDCVGLFGSAGKGTIQNVGLTNVSITGHSNVGGLIGYFYNSATVNNCYTTGSVTAKIQNAGGLIGQNDGSSGINTVSQCHSGCTVTSDTFSGGLIGNSSLGTINACYATGAVSITGNTFSGGLIGFSTSGVTNCYATGSVTCTGNTTESYYIGGLIGYYDSTGGVTNCYATGSVLCTTTSFKSAQLGGLIGATTGGTVTNCYATGSVTTSIYVYASNIGNEKIGGLIGLNTSTVSSCYATGATYGGTYVGGLMGENNGTVSDSYSTGTVSSNGLGGYYGGLIGHNKTSVSKCYSISPIVNGAAHPGLVGDNSGNVAGNCFWNSSINTVGYDNNSSTFSAVGKTTAQMQTASTFTGAGWSPSTWSMIDNIYPALVAYLKAPTITTQAVNSISSTTATGNGTISDFGYPASIADYGVCWNTTGTPIITDNKTDNGVTSTTGTFTAGLTSLVPNTTYFVRAFAKNNAVAAYGTQVSFTTTAIAPTVTSVSATGITGTGALLNGSVNANNTSTTVTFDYGTTSSPYLHTDIASTPGTVTGTSATSVSLAVSGLTPNTTYHFRVKGVNTAGTTNGTDLTFTTAVIIPTATTTAATAITTTGATLNGSVNANNASTTVNFDYGATTSYGTNVTATPSPVTGTSATAVSYTLTGLTPNTTYHYRVNGVNSAGPGNGLDANFTTLAATSSTFQTTGNWSTASNWSAGIPGASTDVTLAAACNVDGNFPAKSITVNPGIGLTIAAGNTLTISGNLTLKSDASNGTATLINSGTLAVTGTTSVEQYLTSGRNWYLSSPTTGATSSAISNAAYVASYSEPTASWVTETTTLTPLKGYVAVSETANAPITFTGTLNTGNQTNSALTATTANATYQGYNLVGNPYPSYVDWAQATKTNLLTTMWYRTMEGGAYKFYTYNSTGGVGSPSGVTSIIPPMQAFWVNVAAGSTGTIGFTNAMRSHASGSNPLRVPSVESTSQQLLRLQVSDGTNSDETVVYFNPNASDGYDSYDSPKMSNNNQAIPEIYTLSGTEKVVINGLNNSSTYKELPLGFTTGQSNSFSLKATELSNFDADTKIILKDYLLNTEKELATGSEYAFTSDVTSSNSRFGIIFKSSSNITGTNNTDDKMVINIFKNANGQITVQRNGNIGQEGRITVCNAIGQKLISIYTAGTSTVISRSFSSGVYLVSVNIAGAITTKKVVIN